MTAAVRPTPRGPGRPGATAGSQSVLTGQWRPWSIALTALNPKSVSLIRELIAALVTSWWGDGYATIGR